MSYLSVNPATGELLRSFETWDADRLASALNSAAAAQAAWRRSTFEERAAVMRRVSDVLRARREDYAALITLEMGKPIREARAEVEKCTLACDYYALCGQYFLADEPVESDAGKSYVAYQPLGIVLAIMPWNFPFWQAFRAAVPALMAGNGVLLKHASNVPQCALAIQQVFLDGGLPEHLFTTALAEAAQIPEIVADPRVQGVTFTGSEAVGRKVAVLAGQYLKKCVLELGGSDAFVVLRDADLESAIQAAVASRFQNGGQSCIAAKRFIVTPEIADQFVALLAERIAALNVGDPMQDATQVGPLARPDLRDEVHRQVSESIALGAQPVHGCQVMAGEGAFYVPSLLDHVNPQTSAYREELFGPVAAVIRASDEADALRIANDTRFGLGSSIWSRDVVRAERLAGEIQAGCTFINGMVKSDPRLPFGGTKASGFGRELSYHGIREFVNTKTVWIK